MPISSRRKLTSSAPCTLSTVAREPMVISDRCIAMRTPEPWVDRASRQFASRLGRHGGPDHDSHERVGPKAEGLAGKPNNARRAGPHHFDLGAVAHAQLLKPVDLLRLPQHI